MFDYRVRGGSQVSSQPWMRAMVAERGVGQEAVDAFVPGDPSSGLGENPFQGPSVYDRPQQPGGRDWRGILEQPGGGREEAGAVELTLAARGLLERMGRQDDVSGGDGPGFENPLGDRDYGVIRFKGQDFVGWRPSHPGPASHPAPVEPAKAEEQELITAEEFNESTDDKASDPPGEGDRGPETDDRPPEDGHRPAEDGHRGGLYRPADDGTGPTGPRSHLIRPADDGTGPVGPRSSAATRLNLNAIQSVGVRLRQQVPLRVGGTPPGTANR